MIGAIVRFALRFRGLVVGIAAAIIVIGVVTLRDAPVDALPEFTPAYVEIQTESLGLSASEVEQLLTVPLEADLLNGVEGVDVIRSSSLPGLSSIVLVFKPGTDVYKGRQLVQERLTQLGGAAFPNVSKPPTMLQPLSSSSRVMMIGLSSESLTPIQKSVLARWTLRPRLMGVEGVANVAVWGMRDQQIQVQVDPERLRDKGVTLQQVIRTAGNAQIASPVSYLEASVPGTGGFIETPQQRLQVRNVFDKIADPKELGKVTVEGSGGKLRLTDVANVVEDHQPLIGDAVVNDEDGLLLVVEKFPGADAKAVSEGVEDALEKLAPGLSRPADRHVGLPARELHRRGRRQPHDGDHHRGAAARAGARRRAHALAHAARRARDDPDLARRGGARARPARRDVQRDHVRRPGARAGGRRRRRGDRRREHRPAAGAAARRRAASTPVAATVLDATREIRSPLGYAALIALLVIVPLAIMEGRPGAFLAPLAVAYAVAVADGDGHGADADAGARRPAQAGRARLGARRAPRRAVRRRAVARCSPRPRAALAAVAVLGLAVVVALPLMGTVAAADAQGPQRARPPRRRAGTSNPRMTAIAPI